MTAYHPLRHARRILLVRSLTLHTLFTRLNPSLAFRDLLLDRSLELFFLWEEMSR
jgi:hypothetical protein